MPADIPGLEYAGEVRRAPARARRRFKVGDRVMGLVGGGAWAERAGDPRARGDADARRRSTFTDAAAVPEAFVTAFDALVMQGGLRPDSRC